MTGTPATGMDAILGAMTTLTTLMGNVFELMTANPLLTLFLASSVLTVGIGVFAKVKRGAKGN